MLDTKYENLNKYDLKISRNDIIKKKEKRNDLRNILFFPSLFWFNGQFSPPLPYLKYNELRGYEIKDYLTCSIHKHSVIVRRILKNEILNISMFNEKKVLSCLFYINIGYILKLLNIYVKKENSLLNNQESFSSSNEIGTYQLFCYNEKNEICLFDVEKSNFILSICEKKQITCLHFNFIYINEKNSLYNKLLYDVYEDNIKIIDLDNIDKKIIIKNKYCFELLQEKFIDNSYKKNEFKILRNIYYVLVYGDDEGNTYFFVPEKKIKIKKKLANKRIQFIETNVKEFFKVKTRNDLLQTIKSNNYIFIAFNDSIHILNFYIFETYFIINFMNEKLFCLTTKFNYLWHNYLSFSTKNYVKIFNINEKKELHSIRINNVIEKNSNSNEISKDDITNCKGNKINNIDVSNLGEQNKDRDYNNSYKDINKIEAKKYAQEDKEEKSKNNNCITQVKNMDANKKEKELNYYTCIYFDLKDNLYISNNKGLINIYNLCEEKIVNTFDINCKVIFYLLTFTLKNNEYIYVYDSEKFYCLFHINKQKIIYKIFTIGLWIYHILCFHNNIIFSLGNENLYNLLIESSKRNFLKSIYSNSINICIYLINHPHLPIIAFLNKKLVFGFFFLTDTKNVIIPSIKENQNIVSICWFKKSRNYFLDRGDGMKDDITNNEETSFAYDSMCSENNNREILQRKKKRKKRVKKNMEHNNDFDTYIAVLNENALYLYNIVNKEIKKLNNNILKGLFNSKGKKYISSCIINDICYVLILSDKKLVVFDEYWNFCSYIIKIDEKINKMYLKEDILFLHSNINIYFTFTKHIINIFMKTNYYMDENIEQSLNKKVSNEKVKNENKMFNSYELHFIKLKLKQKFKIILFDFYYMNNEIYLAIFSKKKQILVYKVNLSDDCVEETYENKNLEISADLVAQFFNFYIFDHINKVGSILCMKFFYNSKKKKIYLAFGGLEQFLFLWNFSKYSIIQKK